MSEYTKGPWVIDEGAEHQEPGFYGSPGDPEGYHSVSANDWRVTGFIGDANARLIAAAPEMLEALEHIREYWNGNENERAMADALGHILETASAAIAKATGEST